MKHQNILQAWKTSLRMKKFHKYARALSLQKRSIGIEKFCRPGKVPLTWKSSISVEMKYCISIVTFYGHKKFFQTQKSFISLQKF